MRHYCSRCKVWEWERNQDHLPHRWTITVIIVNGTVADRKLCKACTYELQRFMDNEPTQIGRT